MYAVYRENPYLSYLNVAKKSIPRNQQRSSVKNAVWGKIAFFWINLLLVTLSPMKNIFHSNSMTRSSLANLLINTRRFLMCHSTCAFSISVNSRWTGYGAWGACSTRCGSGTQTRSRSCIAGNACGTGCSGPSTESRACGMAVGEF